MPADSDLSLMIQKMEPVLNSGTFVFVTVPHGESVPFSAVVVASIREPEGLSLVLEENEARRLGLEPMFRCAWITLSVNSDLATVGLTAAFSSALGEAGISCNVISGALHDHIFVPVALANEAMNVLRALQLGASAKAAFKNDA